jgi:hypothetical protein
MKPNIYSGILLDVIKETQVQSLLNNSPQCDKTQQGLERKNAADDRKLLIYSWVQRLGADSSYGGRCRAKLKRVGFHDLRDL